MCIICVEYQKGNLTPREAFKAGTELILTDPNVDAQHVIETLEALESEIDDD